jgi:hypothetical protein
MKQRRYRTTAEDLADSAQGTGGRLISTEANTVLAAGIAVVVVFYLWLASVGSWNNWPSLTQTYDQLASGFLLGQLSLPEAPAPALLALENPYRPSGRQGVSFPLDVSLYNGRFYLYFGPVPAVLLALAKLILPAVIGDEYLVFLFTAGLFIVEGLTAHYIWMRSFQHTSLWGLGAGLLVLGLTAPMGWLLSTANVYAAAVMSGAFFFAAGMYAALRALNAAMIGRPALVLAGTMWVLAVGSRITQIVPVGLLTLLVGAEIIRRLRRGGTAAISRAVLALTIPLALGAVTLGWYNWARFGSVFESGIRYQLSGGFQEHWGQLFSPAYVLQNLFNYLLAPPKLGYAFPYFKPTGGLRESILPGIAVPDIYWSSPMTGLLFTSPFVLLSIVNAVQAARMLRWGLGAEHGRRSLHWPTAALWTAFLSSFGVYLTFFWSAERYIADFAPAWFILSVIGLWQLGEILAPKALGRALHALLGATCLGVTILVSNLYALAFHADGFRALNPVLWRQLGNLFRP